jgi:hypothetical protein
VGAAGRRPPLAPGAVHRRGVPPGGRLPAPSGPRPVHGRLRHEPDRARPPARPAAGAGPATRGPRPLRAPARPAVPARRRVPPVGVPLGDRVAVAVTDLGPVGIDVERHAPRAAEPAGTVLSPAEAAGYARLPEAERATALIEYWARKEAVRKAPLSPLGRVRRCGTGAGGAAEVHQAPPARRGTGRQSGSTGRRRPSGPTGGCSPAATNVSGRCNQGCRTPTPTASLRAGRSSAGRPTATEVPAEHG